MANGMIDRKVFDLVWSSQACWSAEDSRERYLDFVMACEQARCDALPADRVEAVARALCIADGKNPDADWRDNGSVMLDVALPRGQEQEWRTYTGNAKASILADDDWRRAQENDAAQKCPHTHGILNLLANARPHPSEAAKSIVDNQYLKMVAESIKKPVAKL
jgi:hypothetical protein